MAMILSIRTVLPTIVTVIIMIRSVPGKKSTRKGTCHDVYIHHLESVVVEVHVPARMAILMLMNRTIQAMRALHTPKSTHMHLICPKHAATNAKLIRERAHDRAHLGSKAIARHHSDREKS